MKKTNGIPKFKILHILTGQYITLYKSKSYLLLPNEPNTTMLAQSFRTKEKAKRHLASFLSMVRLPGKVQRVYHSTELTEGPLMWYFEHVDSADEFEIIVYHV